MREEAARGEPSAAAITVRHLVKRYGEKEAVRGVSFEVPKGTVFGLLGPNGAGKTSVLECLLGLRAPDAGEIYVGGVNTRVEPELAKQKLGAVLQTMDLQDRITPREAVELFGAFYPQASSPDQSLRRFRLTEKADVPFETLSAGQRQRLALALAFVHGPEVLCLDEPTTGLDAQSRRDLHGLIRQVQAEGKTILLTTHHPAEAHALCDRVAVLRDGQIVASGPPGELVARSKVFPRLLLNTVEPLEATALLTLTEVLSVEMETNETRLEVSEVGAGVVALVRLLEATGNELIDLRVLQPSLEDTLIELTGESGGPNP